MLRAGSVEIPMPDNDILLAAEQALFTEQAVIKEKIRELEQLNREVEERSKLVYGGDFIRAQITDLSEHMIFISRSLNWVRAARSSFLHEGDKHVK